MLLSPEQKHALLLSTLAGLSNSIGGAIAIIRKPGPGLLSFLLGVAIGVMATLSVAEMYIRNAYEHGFWSTTAAMLLGVFLYYIVEPCLPSFDYGEKDSEAARPNGKASRQQADQQETRVCKSEPVPAPSATKPMSPRSLQAMEARTMRSRHRELLRLGLVMALAMTLHNLPEGFAVAFSAFTDFGAVMALAIAIHNIPEGVIVAAPVYAATGSRWKAMGIAVASGLSEPLGALIALLFIHPFLTPVRLQYMLACVGGIMMAVCGIELWPEARKCQEDWRLAQGVVLGTVVMGWTLLYT